MDPADQGRTAGKIPGSFLSLLERSRTWFVMWLVWFMVLCILSSMSHPGPHIDVAGIDKVEHTIYFAAGGTFLLLALALRGRSAAAALTGTSWRKLALVVLIAGAAVGWLDEWHQSFTPGRNGLDFYDWIADITGSLAALPLARLFLRRLASWVPDG